MDSPGSISYDYTSFVRRQNNSQSAADQFLNLIADPFQSQIQVNSVYAAVIWSLVGAISLFLLFVLLRPRISHVYACRSKHTDERHAPPRLNHTLLGWIPALRSSEEQLIYKIGLDAVVFLRFIRMLRDLFIALTIVGCAVVIPVNVVGVHSTYNRYNSVSNLLKLTPQYSYGKRYWAYVVLAYVIQAIVCGLIWWHYRAVYRLRQAYLRSDDYVNSLHSRTLLIRHLPPEARTDTGIAEIVSSSTVVNEMPRTTVGRNVAKWNLPQLIKEHNNTVRKLEKYLTKYLADPDHVPSQRPLCKPAKRDKTTPVNGKGKVDAISYLEFRRVSLATEILKARESVDQRDPELYGFASYNSVRHAHMVAYENRHSRSKGGLFVKNKKHPSGVSIELSPAPKDILWQNLSMTRAKRRHRTFLDSLWMTLLTLLFIGPNILTAVFLSNFSHLGQLWPAFQRNLKAHPVGWAIAQGILAPAIQFLFYLVLPSMFRRLLTHSGDPSRTSRERHVLSSLYAFYVINQLIVFSVFATVVRYVSAVVASKDKNVWHAINNGHLFTQLVTGLCSVSTFWLTWQLQQNLSSAVDVAQLLPLVLSWFKKRFTHPTPRELIELSAPQPIDYASYYNAYLFSATVGLCFATLQPLILPVTLFFLGVEYWFKKYLVQYVFFTKTESGAAFWRVMVNRLLFAAILSNAVVALVVGSQGVGAEGALHNGSMLYAMIPLPFLLIGFKYYLLRHFDSKMGFVSADAFDGKGAEAGLGADGTTAYSQVDRDSKGSAQSLRVKFGHPALFDQLIAPMVHARSQHLVSEVLGRPKSYSEGNDGATPNYSYDAGSYTDESQGIHLGSLDSHVTVGGTADGYHRPSAGSGHGDGNESTTALVPQIVVVREAEPDLQQYKDRPEFRDEFGGEGQMYGEAEDALLGGMSEDARDNERIEQMEAPPGADSYGQPRTL